MCEENNSPRCEYCQGIRLYNTRPDGSKHFLPYSNYKYCKVCAAKRRTYLIWERVNFLLLEDSYPLSDWMITVRMGEDPAVVDRLTDFTKSLDNALRYKEIDNTWYFRLEWQRTLFHCHFGIWLIDWAMENTAFSIFNKYSCKYFEDAKGEGGVHSKHFPEPDGMLMYVTKMYHEDIDDLTIPNQVKRHPQTWKYNHMDFFERARQKLQT